MEKCPLFSSSLSQKVYKKQGNTFLQSLPCLQSPDLSYPLIAFYFLSCQKIPIIFPAQYASPSTQLEKIPYKITGPAIVNIL